MTDANEFTLEQRNAIKAEAREAASKEIDLFISRAKDYFMAIHRYKTLLRNLDQTCSGHDILTVLTDDGPTDKEWARLLTEKGNAADREHSAEQKLGRVLDRVFAKHGLQTARDVNQALLEKQVRMTKDEWDAESPEGVKIKDELLEEFRQEARKAFEPEQPHDGKWAARAKGARPKGRQGRRSS
jgi:hypothetical protein